MAEIRVVDVAARAREMYGDQAAFVAGRPLPEHDYRFEAVSITGANVTFGATATAAYVAVWLAERGELPMTGGPR
jgi:hypothetical protein